MSLSSGAFTVIGPGPSNRKKKDTGKSEVQFKRVPIQIRKAKKISKVGPKIALIGPQYSGKTGLMLSTAYINTDFSNLFSDEYPIVYKALKNGVIPEVESLFVIESENTMENQISNPLGLPWFRELLDSDRLSIVTLDVAARRDKMNKDRSVEIDIGSIEKIEQVHDQYIQCIDYITNDIGKDPSVAVGLDSGSRLYKLLNQKNQILVQKRTARTVSDKVIEHINQASWEWRNAWWNEIFTNLRGHPGFVTVTFMMERIPEHYLKQGENPFKVQWVKGTQFNFDQVYETGIDQVKGGFKVSISSMFKSRYYDRSPDAVNSWNLGSDGRLAIFKPLEEMLKLAGEW